MGGLTRTLIIQHSSKVNLLFVDFSAGSAKILKGEELWPFSLTELCFALVNAKWCLASPLARSFYIAMCRQNFIKIFHMVEEMRHFPYYHIFYLSSAFVNEKGHLGSQPVRSCRYQSVSKKLSKCSQKFKSYSHFCCHIFGLSLASVNEKWHLAIPLVRC